MSKPAVHLPKPTSRLPRPMTLLFVGAAILALLVRLPLLAHSLWYDELYTLLQYAAAPISKVVAGSYSPNNHVTYTLLAKATASLGDGPLIPALIRLPSVFAGVLMVLLLAFSLGQTRPRASAILLLLCALHPWAIVISGWARGYALMLALAVLATWLLSARRVAWGYALSLAAAIYTIPLALLLVPAHGFVLGILGGPGRGQALRRWALWAGGGTLLGLGLYLPMLGGIRAYWADPGRPSLEYAEFLSSASRHALAGRDLPAMGAGLLVCVVGGVMAWRRWPEFRVVTGSFALVSVLGLLAPLLASRLGEVRAMVWLIPLCCIGLAALLDYAWSLRAWAGMGFLVVISAALLCLDVTVWATPAQPIANALRIARDQSSSRRAVVGVYMASSEAAAVYGVIGPVVMKSEQLTRIETLAPRPLYAVVFYPRFMERDEPQLWAHVQRYRLVERLEGLVSPVHIYRLDE